MAHERSTDPIIATLQEVVAIPSVNPGLPGGTDGERGMADYLTRFFADAGIACEEWDALPGRPNVVATLPGRDPTRAVLFECHMDTATAEGMTIEPFEPVVKDGKVFGRGSADTKAGGVAMLHAMLRIARSGEPPPVSVMYAGAVDEEYRMRGAAALADALPACGTRVVAAVVAEPTELRIVRAHKGIIRAVIDVHGTAAHSSKPHLGASSIGAAARLITAFDEEVGAGFAALDDGITGVPTHNVGTIHGGLQVNFVPAECRMELDRRILPSEDFDAVLDPYRRIAARAAEDAGVTIDVTEDLSIEPMETPADAPIVAGAAAAVRAVTGTASVEGEPYGTDAAKLSAAGIPSIVLGPGSIDQAHAAVEWIECAQVRQAVEVYHRIMLDAATCVAHDDQEPRGHGRQLE
ncbi:MAG: ArgE/DapE family deacylase [Spirochaetaceae bacterium]|nr:ArgE/DapE family deacylase [Spirochaetaceae bacterium]